MKKSRTMVWSWIFTAGLWLCFFIPVGLLLISADRGLEMTDEASYLLIAQDPWTTRGHGTFFGFALYPLWHLAGEQLAAFRQLGFLLSVLMGLVLAQALECRIFGAMQPDPRIRAGLYGSLLVASLGIYVDGIRTISYNWLAWWGAGLFLASLLRPAARGWVEWAWTGIGALGLLVLVLGKWGAALVLVFSAGAFLLAGRGDAKIAPDSRVRGILGGGLLLLLLAGFGIGKQGLGDTLQAGILISRETGSHGLWLVQKYAWEIFYYLYRLGRAFVWILPLGWVAWLLWNRFFGHKPDFRIFGPALFALGSGLALARGYGVGGTLAFSKESIIAGGWWVGLLWLGWKIGGVNCLQGLPWRGILHFLITPFLLGIGTNTSLADYAGHGALFVVVSGWMVAAPWLPQIGAGPWLAVLTSLAVLQGARVATSLEHSYRIGSVWEQTAWLQNGPEKGKLRLQPDLADFMERLGDELEKHGFGNGDPVVGISDLCGVVYLAGGRSPGVPWFFGQVAGQKPYTQAVLGWLTPDQLQRIWIFRSTGTQLAGPLSSFWPATTPVPVPRLAGTVSEFPSELGNFSLEIYKPKE
jgi:hypothetical protein